MERYYKDFRKYFYFSHFSDNALEALAKKFHPIEYPAGTEIIKEGATPDAFYLVSNGKVEVLKKNKWGQTAKIFIIGHGKGFGEMAFLTSSSRYCSVKAKTDISLLKISSADFEEILLADSVFHLKAEKKVQRYAQYDKIKTLQPFALLEPEKVVWLCLLAKERRYSPGENIIVQGEKGDVYYIIQSGRVAVLKKMLKEEFEQVAILHEGEGFGEEALITSQPRSATVQAIDETTVWTLSNRDFEEVMKSTFLKEITCEEVLSQTDKTINYLDVRMKIEYDEEHISGAILIPLDELRKRYNELDPNLEYFVYCRSGKRSAIATFLLNSLGVKAKNIKGGIINWPGPVVEGTEG